MNVKALKMAFAALSAVGACAATAQEMGGDLSTEVVEAPAVAPEASVAPDEGPKIAVETQAEPSAEAGKGVVAVESRAYTIVQRMLRSGKTKYKTGYDPKRRSIISIGFASAPVANPAESPNYIEVRQNLAAEAVLNAKVQIIRALRQEISAMERIVGSDSAVAENFKKKHAEEIARLQAQQKKVETLVAALDEAEAAKLRGRTVLDDWNSVVDAVVSRLNAKYDPNSAQNDKVERCKALAVAVQEAKDSLKALEEAASKEPQGRNTSEFSTYFEMDIYGVTVLYQAESYDTSGNYEVAVAAVWSPKLQDRALRMINGMPVDTGVKGPCSFDDWLVSLDENDNLAAMVGPRQFTDDEGIPHLIGISACEVPKNANRMQNAFEKNQLTAEQTVAFALYESTKGNKSKKDEMLKYDGEDNISAKENDTLGSYVKTIGGIIAKRPVSALSVVYSADKIHPISGKLIHIDVATIDGALAAAAEDFLDDATAAKMEDVAATQYKEGRQDAREAAVKAAEESGAAREAGVRDGAVNVSDALKKRNGVENSGVIVIQGEKTQNQGTRVRTGVITGDTDACDDF